MNKSSPGSHTPRARKRFGQNFLKDESIVERIAQAIAPNAGDHLVEIGPGYGALTKALIDRVDRIDVIELDRDLAPYLLAAFSTKPQFHFHQGDALKFTYESLAPSAASERCLRIVGNLPYNISTPLLFRLLDARNIILDMHFMLQLEVVKRLTAAPGDKLYGRLGVMIQYFCQTALLFEVPPESFDPAPKVQSAIVKLTPRTHIDIVAQDFKHFESLVRQAFSMRRKTLRNTLKPLFAVSSIEKALDTLELSASLRPENLSVSQYVNLSNTLLQLDS